jgi:hypothetical protein
MSTLQEGGGNGGGKNNEPERRRALQAGTLGNKRKMIHH